MANTTDNTTMPTPGLDKHWAKTLIEIRQHFDSDQQMVDAFNSIHDRLPETLALCDGNVTLETFAAAMKTVTALVSSDV
jgi:hypothetical protein